MNSYVTSAADCQRDGTRPRPRVDNMRKAEAPTTVSAMNKAELVKEKSTPPTSMGISFSMVNWWIGS